VNPLDSLSRPEWIEWRLDRIEAYMEERPLPQELVTFTKQARKMIVLETVKRARGQSKLEDF